MKVSVVMAFPTSQQVITLDVDEHCTARGAVAQAVQQGLNVEYPDFDVNGAPLGVYGEVVADDKTLEAGDRVEIYRPLAQDPMELRRRRALESARLPGRRK